MVCEWAVGSVVLRFLLLFSCSESSSSKLTLNTNSLASSTLVLSTGFTTLTFLRGLPVGATVRLSPLMTANDSDGSKMSSEGAVEIDGILTVRFGGGRCHIASRGFDNPSTSHGGEAL